MNIVDAVRKTRKPRTKKKSLIETYRPYLVPIVIGGIVVLIMLLLLIQSAGTQLTLSKLIDQSSRNGERIDAIVQSLLIETKYTNELRAQMGLSKIEYPIQTLLRKEKTEDGGSDDMLALFRAADTAYATYTSERNSAEVDAAFENPVLVVLQKKAQLAPTRIDPLTVSFAKNGLEYFRIRRNTDNPGFTVTTAAGNDFEIDRIDEQTGKKLASLLPSLDEHVKRINESIEKLKSLASQTTIAAVLKERNIEIVPAEVRDGTVAYTLVHKKLNVLEIGLVTKDNSFYIGDRRFGKFEDLLREFEKTVSSVDLRNETEKMVEKVRFDFQKSLVDKGFSTYLASRKMNVSVTPREDYYFYYYDITVEGRKIGSFAIDRFGGDIYLMDPDDVQIGSLQAVMEGIDTAVKKN